MGFCRYCGSQIEEGQQCNCEASKAARAAAQQARQLASGQPGQQPRPQASGQPGQQPRPQAPGQQAQQPQQQAGPQLQKQPMQQQAAPQVGPQPGMPQQRVASQPGPQPGMPQQRVASQPGPQPGMPQQRVAPQPGPQPGMPQQRVAQPGPYPQQFAGQQVPPQQAMQQPNAAAVQRGPSVASQFGTYLKLAFGAPSRAMEMAYTSAQHAAQFVYLLIYGAVAFLVVTCSLIGLESAVEDFNIGGLFTIDLGFSSILIGLAVGVLLMVFKALQGIVGWLLNDTQGSFVRSFSTFCITTIPNTMLAILYLVFTLMDFGSCAVVSFFLIIVVDALYSVFAFKAMIKNSDTRVAYAVIILSAVFTTVMLAFIGYEAESIFSSALKF